MDWYTNQRTNPHHYEPHVHKTKRKHTIDRLLKENTALERQCKQYYASIHLRLFLLDALDQKTSKKELLSWIDTLQQT